MRHAGERRFQHDVVVIGSGFGGSVSALRLIEKGYRVAVLEAGKRYRDDELPETSWRVRKFLWAPALGLTGIQRIHRLKHVIVLAGAGVGGGSLNYANTLYVPSESFFRDPQWAGITDWHAELLPYYEQATRMLGVVRNPTMTPSDVVMKQVAEQMGVGPTFTLTPVGVFFGPDDAKAPGVEVDDPFFGGVGPRRAGCRECGSCMTGCRYNAKNTLVKNYLYLAERNGAVVHAETTVRAVRPLPGGGYAIDVERTAPVWRRRVHGTITAEQVVFAAGALGTQRLLHRMRDEGHLPRISPMLGVLSRTNSESLNGATMLRPDPARDFTQGVAITSSFHPDDDTHVEPVRYGKGSNLMGLLATILTEGGRPWPRWVEFLAQVLRHPVLFIRAFNVRRWSERTIIGLVMQSLDNSLTLRTKRGLLGRRLTSEQGHGEPNPTWIPAGNEAARRAAAIIGGVPGGNWGDLINAPMTAHFIGGCVIGATAQHGVLDPYQRVYGHPGLHVVDGSAISANLGVNPSLTITAQAERAMALWPNVGEDDVRPALGSPYRRVQPVPPKSPVVPEHAPAALRLPVAPAGTPRRTARRRVAEEARG